MIIYICIGFLAQMIDGSLGMGYGVSCRTFLRTATRLPAPVASAVVHIAEIPSSLVSGISHWRIGNVDRRLLLKLMIPGVIGGILGARFLVGIGDRLELYIDIYLIIMGLLILKKAVSGGQKSRSMGRLVYPVGFAGGFLDAVGGGGWGPVVTSTMVAAGGDVKKTIGTVNTAEFIVTIAETTTFAFFITGFADYRMIILGLIIGGVIAAPIAARVCRSLPVRPLMMAVGILVVVLKIYNIVELT